MLSTLSSLLPSVLSDKLEKLDSNSEQAGHTEQIDDEGVKRRDMIDGTKKEKEKEKKKKSTSNETFIVVRPPPAKSNHPLNLQLQLVPAQHTRDRSSTSAAATPTNSRFSADFTQGNEPAAQPPPSPAASESDQTHDLQRSTSVRSNRSETSVFYSSAASSGSVTSFASTASNASGRRMIIPLYNLSAHNVMTNTVLDAGTDAKVAKFLKRGLEIIGLAILEPIEVWNGQANNTDGVPMYRSPSGNSLVPPGPGGSRSGTPEPQHSPGSSRLSISSEHSSNAVHVIEVSATPTTPNPTGAKKLFGRMFRKKESSGGGGGGGGGHTPTASVSTIPAEPAGPAPTLEVRAPTTPTTPARHAVEVVLPPVLGLSPTLAGEGHSGRCVAHVWTVRRWLKTDNQGLISGVIGKISREVSSHGYGNTPDPLEWEVRFEWARGRSKDEKARKAARRLSVDVGGRGSQTPSRRNSALLGLEDVAQQGQDRIAVSRSSPRQSLDVVREHPSARAPSPRRASTVDATKAVSIASTDDEGSHSHEDHAEDSDPEDSETPWTCTLVLTHPNHPIAQLAPRSGFSKSHSRTRTVSSSGIIVTPSTPTPGAANMSSTVSDSGHAPPSLTPIRVRVATLSPAPHHPKVVCQLKVPFPLPDVEVDHGVLRKRLVLPDGSTRSTVPRERPGLVMTAEEIKDVVCSTAFWVVVRQGFGGLGKKNRKGDGWKIRG